MLLCTSFTCTVSWSESMSFFILAHQLQYMNIPLEDSQTAKDSLGLSNSSNRCIISFEMKYSGVIVSVIFRMLKYALLSSNLSHLWLWAHFLVIRVGSSHLDANRPLLIAISSLSHAGFALFCCALLVYCIILLHVWLISTKDFYDDLLCTYSKLQMTFCHVSLSIRLMPEHISLPWRYKGSCLPWICAHILSFTPCSL